jgi:hypothetical protein
LQLTGGFRQGQDVPQDARGFVGAQGTSVFGWEPEGGKWNFALNFPVVSWLDVGQLSAGPYLTNLTSLGAQAAVTRNWSNQRWSAVLEAFAYGEHGSSFSDAGVAGPSAWGFKWGFGLGIGKNWAEKDLFLYKRSQTSTVSLNFDYYRENIWVGAAGGNPASNFLTNTFLFTFTFGYRKP